MEFLFVRYARSLPDASNRTSVFTVPIVGPEPKDLFHDFVSTHLPEVFEVFFGYTEWCVIVANDILILHSTNDLREALDTFRKHILILPLVVSQSASMTGRQGAQKLYRKADSDIVTKRSAWVFGVAGNLGL